MIDFTQQPWHTDGTRIKSVDGTTVATAALWQGGYEIAQHIVKLHNDMLNNQADEEALARVEQSEDRAERKQR